MTKQKALEIYDRAIQTQLLEQLFSYEELVQKADLELIPFKEFLLKELVSLTQEDEGDFVEAALMIVQNLGVPENWLEILCSLLISTFHHSHEEIIRDIQNAEDPIAIPFIQKAIELKPKLQHLDYDDYGAFYKKCLWALYAIGTKESFELIKAYTFSEIPELREEALYRLNKIKV